MNGRRGGTGPRQPMPRRWETERWPRFHPKGGRRRDRLIKERIHDTYKTRQKLSEPTVCPDCGAVYHGGRWAWGDAPAEAARVRCQACHRIAGGYPAGEVTVAGGFVGGHRDEIINLIRNQDQLEQGGASAASSHRHRKPGRRAVRHHYRYSPATAHRRGPASRLWRRSRLSLRGRGLRHPRIVETRRVTRWTPATGRRAESC